MYLVLSYFNAITGPMVMFSVPKPISKRQTEVIEKLMDLSMGENDFFKHTSEGNESKFSIGNLLFSIKSKWARGEVETIMISVVVDDDLDLGIFNPVLKKYQEILKKDPKMYKALYFESNKAPQDTEIAKYEAKLRIMMNECFEECRRITATQKPGKLLILGLQSVGKTSILNVVLNNEYNPNIKPTLGMQIIKGAIDKFDFRIYDVGGQERLRKEWFSAPPPDAIIFVIDATQEDQKEAESEFRRMAENYFVKNAPQKISKDTPVLILANKIDLCQKKPSEKVIEKILKPKNYDMNYKIGLVSALKNQGIEENFKWLVKAFLFA